MENNKWFFGKPATDVAENKARNIVKNAFMRVLERNGFSQVDLPVLDYSEQYILNNEYYMAQKHFKSIAPNGEVLSVLNDIIAGLISISKTAVEGYGKLCASGEEYYFLPEGEEESLEYGYGGIIYGQSGLEEEVDIILAALEYCKELGIKKPSIVISNTDILKGALSFITKKEESISRVRKIINGNFDSDLDYQAAQMIASVKNIEGSPGIIKDLSMKLDNKQSIDGLVDIFEISNILEAYDLAEGVTVKVGYLGKKNYDNGMIFAVLDDSGREIVYGGRCDCFKGKDAVKCLYLKANARNALLVAKEKNYFVKDRNNKVTVAIAPTQNALIKAYKVRKDFAAENLKTTVIYQVEPQQAYALMGEENAGIVIYIDGDGNITHS